MNDCLCTDLHSNANIKGEVSLLNTYNQFSSVVYVFPDLVQQEEAEKGLELMCSLLPGNYSTEVRT